MPKFKKKINYSILIKKIKNKQTKNYFLSNKNFTFCGGAKTWAFASGLSPTFYQQYVLGEEIMGEPRN